MIFSRWVRSRSMALALQGGGTHGAFTWGVLDVLLERCRFDVTAISGTSAGAVNAVVLADGWLRGGPDGAREALDDFWRELGRVVPWDALGLAHEGSRLSPAGRLMLQWAQLFSPAQRNPLQFDPLRDLLARRVDFDRLRQQRQLRLHIAATQANTGRLRLFSGSDLSLEAVLASACLPMVQQAVTIDGEPYWDGGYSANPALAPLLRADGARDVMVVMLSPWTLGDEPRSVDEIRTRATEIAFNATFLREMRMLADASELAKRAWLPGPLERRLRRVRWHLIDGHDALSALPSDSKLIAHPQLLERLNQAGRDRAIAWLDANECSMGRRSSADIGALFANHEPPA
ncbi:MAG: patatin-like phospholipase family protein [Burkholderiaceae bacterium]|nr:patatin-like phospholipase family protein [Burkholderiaceae bacterium]